MKQLTTGLIFLLALSACSEEDPPPENLVAEDTYIDLMVELQLLRSWHEITGDRMAFDSLRQVAFQKYEVDSLQFEESHRFYQQQMEAQKQRIGEAIERLRKDRVVPPGSTGVESPSDTAGAGGNEQIQVDTAVGDTTAS